MKASRWSRWLLLATVIIAVGAPTALRASGDDGNRGMAGDDHRTEIREHDDEGLHRQERQEAHGERDESAGDERVSGEHHRGDADTDDSGTDLRGRTPDEGEAHKSERAKEVEHEQQGERMRRLHSRRHHSRSKPTPKGSDEKPESTPVETSK